MVPPRGSVISRLLRLLALQMLLSAEALNQTRRDGRPPPFLHLPVSVDSRLPLLEREQLSPVTGTGHEPLPESVREILRPVRRPAAPAPGAPGRTVSTWCQLDKMHVRVSRSMLGPDSRAQLKLGTCRPSASTEDHLYFEYDVGRCGTKRTLVNNQVTYSNALEYDPRPQGLIRRAVAFTLPVACYYNRYQYSYKIGYMPQVRMRKIFKLMKNHPRFTLSPRNARWEQLSPSDGYVLGGPMFFQAESPSLSPDERLYVHSCYATAGRSHASRPRFPVVTNFGCMVESRDGRSSFVPYKNNGVRFTVDAFLFKGTTGQLHLHCSMSVGSSAPSPTAKSCNYDADAGRWVELYGADSACTCCDAACSSSGSAATEIISSDAWSVEPEGVRRRTTASTWTSRDRRPPGAAVQEGAEPEPEGVRRTASTWTSRDRRPPGAAVQDPRVGSAVVEPETVTQTHRMFEEIFVFDE